MGVVDMATEDKFIHLFIHLLKNLFFEHRLCAS